MSRFCVKKDNKENKMQTPLVEEAPPVGMERSTAFEIWKKNKTKEAMKTEQHLLLFSFVNKIYLQ